MDRARVLCTAFVMSLLLASRAAAETGYVFVGDINQDGVRDRIESGPQTQFGSGGGPFVVTLGSKRGPAKHFGLSLHPLAVTAEMTKDGLKIWSYWQYSADSGDLCVFTLSDKPTRQCIGIHPGDGGTALSNAVVGLIFAKERRVFFNTIEDYKPKPYPKGLEWLTP